MGEVRRPVTHVICVGAESVGLGRAESNGLVLDELSISRHHATLHVEKSRITLTDCCSKFGTFVTLRELKDCDYVRLMNSRWTFAFGME